MKPYPDRQSLVLAPITAGGEQDYLPTADNPYVGWAAYHDGLRADFDYRLAELKARLEKSFPDIIGWKDLPNGHIIAEVREPNGKK